MIRNTARQQWRGRCGSGIRGIAVFGLAFGLAGEAVASPVSVDLAYLDTSIRKRYPDVNFAASQELEVSGGPGILASASLLLPDLGPLAGNFILRATLMITKVETFPEACCKANEYPISAQAIGSAWIPDEVTWKSQPLWGSPSSSLLVSSDAPRGTQYEFDITEIVRAWVDGELPNWGLAVAVDEFFATPGNTYAASEGAPLERPRLTVLMTPEPGTLILLALGLSILTRMRGQLRLIGHPLAA